MLNHRLVIEFICRSLTGNICLFNQYETTKYQVVVHILPGSSYLLQSDFLAIIISFPEVVVTDCIDGRRVLLPLITCNNSNM